jgi:hypothetical protein
MDAQETQQGPSRGVRTTIETPSWELSAVDELLHHTVGMLFERETEVFDEGAASQRPIRAFFGGGGGGRGASSIVWIMDVSRRAC